MSTAGLPAVLAAWKPWTGRKHMRNELETSPQPLINLLASMSVSTLRAAADADNPADIILIRKDLAATAQCVPVC